MRKILIVIIIALGCNEILAQDPHFSQFRMTPLLMNPARTGLGLDMRAQASYRQQWKSVATPFTSAAFSFDMNATRKKKRKADLGVGLQFLNDKAGDAKVGMNQGNLNLSGILNLGPSSKLGLGLMGGFGQRSVDYSALRWESQYQGGTYNSGIMSGENLSSNSFTYFDAGTGICYSYGKDQGYMTQNASTRFTIGASAFHFGLPVSSFQGVTSERLNTKFVGHASMEIGKRNTNLTFIPEIVYVRQNSQQEVIVGNVFRYLLVEGSHFTGFVQSTAISLGVNYRVKDALITTVILEYAQYCIGFSYDVNMSPLTTSSKSRGGFEVALRFVTPNPFSKSFAPRI